MNLFLSLSVRRAIAGVLSLWMLLSGCATTMPNAISGDDLMATGQYDLAVAKYIQALESDPSSHQYRLKLQEARVLAGREHHRRGLGLAADGRFPDAINELQLAINFDPSLDIARQDLEAVRRKVRSQRLTEDAENFFRSRKFVHAKQVLNRALELDPSNQGARDLMERVRAAHVTVLDGFELDVTADKPITLKFQEANLQDVFNILSQLSGINFLFDEEIRGEKVTVFLENATFAQALELLMKMKGLARKVLNSKTILLYSKTKEKEKQYEDHIIQTFYLSNIDAKKAVNLLRTMLQLRRIFVHEELNALVIRDLPEVIRLSQQILEAADRADSEVVFDVELIEVSRGDESRLGVLLNAYSISLGMSNPGSGTIVSNTLTSGGSNENLVSGLSGLESFYTLPAATFDFAKTLAGTELLASPKIRVKNREKAKVHIGSREPVITVTLTGDTQRSDNVQYVDVGVKLNVEPTVQLDNSVITRLNLEVSSISDRRTLESGTSVFTITTTNAESVLTLRDGERTVIGGLIRDNKAQVSRSVPFFGDLPLFGSLFTHRTEDSIKREILLSITPRIVKNLEMPLPEVATIWSGGEDDLRTGPNFGAFIPEFAPELEKGNPAAVPRLVEPREPRLPVPDEAPPAEPTPAPAQAPAALPSEPQAFVPPPSAPALPPAPVVESPVVAIAPVPVPQPEPQVAPPTPPPVAARELEAVVVAPIVPIEIAGVPGMGQVFLGGPELVRQGETFALSINVAEVQSLYSAPLYLNFDADKLEFVRAREGDFLKSGQRPTIFTSSIARPGTLIVGYKQGTGDVGASGGGELFRVEFRARAPGVTQVEVDRVNFRNPAGERISVVPTAKRVEVR
ncbi:cohesin domain-containing protein [Geoalkalibacter sp.]|uniref:cohesin domain-containing protein n=1 Tax=Geoalkalibacter sp. TaxID=3041440 RepID=UPI00272DF021|nr:cohesin domain-containing protein [Geoalkalibacter sp.]